MESFRLVTILNLVIGKLQVRAQGEDTGGSVEKAYVFGIRRLEKPTLVRRPAVLAVIFDTKETMPWRAIFAKFCRIAALVLTCWAGVAIPGCCTLSPTK
jgi:hypothetical protein